MAKGKLTNGRINAFTCPQGKEAVFLWDTVTQGFGLKTSKGGRKVFVFQGKLSGRDIRITIGAVSSWGIDDARKEANRLQTLLDQGRDPREEKRERIAADEAKRVESRRRGVTVADAWGAYIKARSHKWSDRHRHDHDKLAQPGGAEKKRGKGTTQAGALTSLMSMKLSDLTAERVEAWLKDETIRRPTQAALAYRLLRAFLRWCDGTPDYQGAAHVEAVGTRVARDHVPKARAKADDCLQREQLQAWFKAVRELENPVISAYLQTLLLTGARREEMAALKWKDLDFQWKSMRIADKVEEGGRIIPLTPYVASLLENLPRRNAWVFSSPTAALGRIKEPRPAHTRALAAAGLPHVSLHGLRRSFGTLAEWVEAPTGVVAQIMWHKPSAIAEKHYRRRPLDLLRMWHARIEAWMLEQAGIKQPKETTKSLRLVK